MNMKIGWYREVLELEPDSRLFLPLARLLAEEGEVEEACRVLGEGLVRHPTFLEARLTYVDLLRRARLDDEGKRQLESLVSSLAAHDGFWQTWASGTADKGELDASLAIRLLALVVRGVKLDLADILRRGIESLEAECRAFDLQDKMGDQAGILPVAREKSARPGPADEPLARPMATPLKPAHANAHAAASAVPQAAGPALANAAPAGEDLVASSAEARDVSDIFELTEPAAVAAQDRAASVMEQAEQDVPQIADASFVEGADDEASEAGDDEGPWPPRTRTMAEVLAEQGDIDAACDIYSELEARAANSAEAMEYGARREELLARRRDMEAQRILDAADAVEDRDDPAPIPARLGPESLGMLNALVNSLQSRVH